MPRRVTYIVANIERAVQFEWVVDLLDGDRFELDFILLNRFLLHYTRVAP